MSLKQNNKKIKLFMMLSLILFISVIIIFIFQIYRLDTRYNRSPHEILVQKSKIVGVETKKLFDKDPKRDYIMASKTGTKYYYQNCSGLSRIKSENLTFFGSEEQAERAGYSLAKNCKKP